MSNVVQDGPSSYVLASDLDEVEIDSVEKKRRGFQEGKNSHQVVYFVHGLSESDIY